MENTKNPLESKSVVQLLLTYSVPAIISTLINSVYNIVDQIFIGQSVGYLGNAAKTVAYPIMTIIAAYGGMLGAGGSAYAAIRMGEGRKEES